MVKTLPIIEMCRYVRFYIVSKCTFVTDNTCRGQSVNMPFYQIKLVLCRFVTTKFLPLVEYAGILNAVVARADSILTCAEESQSVLYIKKWFTCMYH